MKTTLRNVLIGTMVMLATPMGLQESGTLESAGAESIGESHPLLSGPVPDATKHAFQYHLDTTGLADAIVQDGSLTVRTGADEYRELNLAEFELFLPGEQKVVFYDEYNNPTHEEPIEARFFQGTVSGTHHDAFIMVAPEGLYGVIHEPSRRISLQAQAAGDVWIQEVTWVELDGAIIPTDAPALPDLSTSPKLASHTTYQLYVKPVAEPHYRNYASNYASRISSAYGSINGMFASETDIYILLYSVAAPSVNYGSQNTCAGYPDTGLNNFISAWVTPNDWVGPNAYGLFHSVDGQQSLAGCGKTNCSGSPSGCLANSNTGMLNPSAAHAVQGKDYSSADSYDPDETGDLGLAVGHELTHNAGEPSHPSDSKNCAFLQWSNIMSQEAFWCIDDWRTSTSQSRVETYSWSRIHS